jgi:hypothetical protein
MSDYLAVLVAAIVAWHGYQQHRLERERFKLDLFEKRFGIYRATQKLLGIIGQKAAISLQELFEYVRDTQDAVFLFDQEIVDYLTALYKKGVDLQTTQAQYDPLPVGEERTRLCEKENRLLKEFGDEILRLKDVFAPYLKFERWKSPFSMKRWPLNK